MDLLTILVYIILTVAIYFYAERLDRSGGKYVLVSIIISPLLTWILLLAMGNYKLKDKNGDMLSSKDGVHEWKD